MVQTRVAAWLQLELDKETCGTLACPARHDSLLTQLGSLENLTIH